IVSHEAMSQMTCRWWQTDPWCDADDIPDPNWPGGGAAPGGESGNAIYFRVANASSNPYPATCGSSREQRILHAQYDIAADLLRPDSYPLSPYDAFQITYDDGRKQDYRSDLGQESNVPGVNLILLGGNWTVANGYQIDSCD